MKNISPIFCLFLIFFQFVAYRQNDESKGDWANLKKYAAANKNLPPPTAGEDRIVFMGNSITEFWAIIDSSFFANWTYIDRGISGQTSPQMLLRFRQDVINLKPTVVAILAGINDIAENTGKIALEDVFGNIENNIEYVDYYSNMVDEKKGLDRRFTEDGVHPTIAGYKIMEPLIERAIKRELELPKIFNK